MFFKRFYGVQQVVFIISAGGGEIEIRGFGEQADKTVGSTVAFRKKNYSVRVGKTINLKKKLKSGTDSSKGSLWSEV